MKNPFENKELWFFVGSQDLYGGEVLQKVAEQSKKIYEALDASPEIPVKIILKPTLKSHETILQAFHDANRNENCIGIILWMHTFSPAKMWIRGLTANTKPLLQLNTQSNIEVPWDSINMDFMNLNQSAHGDREFGYIMTRLNIARKVVVGHYSNPRFMSRIGKWSRAAAGWDALNHLKVCRIGDNMRNVAVTEGDKIEAESKFGLSVNTWGVNELVARVEAASDKQIQDIVDEYFANYNVVPELCRGGKKHQSLIDAARIEVGLRTFLEELGAHALTDTFEDLGSLQQLPGVAIQRLMCDGYGFAAEGDWKTSALVRLSKVMGYGLPGGASLMEDYTYNLMDGKEGVLGAHMLEICPTLTTVKPNMEIHHLGIGGKSEPVRLVFNADAKEGALVVTLLHLRDRFRLLANSVNVISPEYALPKLPVARAFWQPDPSLETSVECWLAAGGGHHTVMTTATDCEIWEDFARISDVEFAVIDKNTTTRGFCQMLKSTQAYYKLSEGF